MCKVTGIFSASVASAVFLSACHCVAFGAPPAKDVDVNPASLAELVDRADRLVVLDTQGEKNRVLFESKERKDLDALKSALKVRAPERPLHCMCDGSPKVALYAKGERIGLITNHHAVLIRCDLWTSDAVLMEPEALLKWFDGRKIPGPRKEYDLALRMQKEADEAERRWLAAMPPPLKPHWRAATQSRDRNLDPMRKALSEEVKNPDDRVLCLFAWFGSGEGPWSGYPAYEKVAETLLLDYSTADLLGAIKDRELTSAQIEGVARLFGGFVFSRDRPKDLALFPADLTTRLLKHSLMSDNEDKRRRARQAFEK
jgi:hypothetical protein